MNESSRASTNPWLLRLSIAAVAAAVAACYAHTLDVPWYLDDLGVIVNNPVVQDLRAATAGVLSPRGLTLLTFALDHAVSGYSLATFHLTNIGLHLAAGIVGLLLLRRIFPERPWVALFAALVFVVHPVQTSAVTYVVQRLSVLAGLLSLAASLLYLMAVEHRAEAGRSGPRFLALYGGSLACAIAAILAKENAAALPLLLAVLELTLPGRRSLPRRRLLWILPFLVVSGVFALRSLGVSFFLPGGTATPAPFDPNVVAGAGEVSRLAYLSTETEVVWRYLRLVVWPVGQLVDAGLTISPEPFRGSAVLAAAALGGLVAALWAVRRRIPALSLGLLWFLAALSVESSIIPLDPYFEHRLYLPVLGAGAAVAGGLAAAVRDRRALGAIGLAIVVALAGLTIRRNEEWRDPVRLWSADLAHGSASYRSAFGLVDALRSRGYEARAQDAYETLLDRGAQKCRLGGCGAAYLYNLGVAAERLGRLETASAYYVRALQANGAYSPAHFGLGVTAYREGRKQEALEHFRAAVTYAPGNVVAVFNLATVAAEMGDPGPARANLDRIRSYDPGLAAELEADLRRLGFAGR